MRHRNPTTGFFKMCLIFLHEIAQLVHEPSPVGGVRGAPLRPEREGPLGRPNCAVDVPGISLADLQGTHQIIKTRCRRNRSAVAI